MKSAVVEHLEPEFEPVALVWPEEMLGGHLQAIEFRWAGIDPRRQLPAMADTNHKWLRPLRGGERECRHECVDTVVLTRSVSGALVR